MSEDRTAEAAIAIERYVAGLREELAILSPHDSKELTNEIGDMLKDAAREDPEAAFAEMERLGEPAELAGTLLEERGLTASAGIPAASWWRLGAAAVIDIAVGLAAPVLIVVTFWNVTVTSFSDHSPAAWVLVAGVGSALALTLFLSWRYWTPWRDGGRATTPGMAVAHIAVLKIGDARTVSTLDDMKRAGLPSPTVTAASPGVIATLLFALLFLSWAGSAVLTGALDPSGTGVIERYVGGADSQKEVVRSTVDWLYNTAAGEQDGADWPPMDLREFTTYPDGSPTATLAARYAGTGADVPDAGYKIESMSNPDPGVWDVTVAETPAKTAVRRVLLTFVLRLQWTPHSGAQPHTDWVLSDYLVK